MQDNPFAPPSAKADASADRGLVFSPEGAAVVASLATWMRGMSIILYVAMALLLVGSCGILTMPREEAVIGTLVFLVIALLVGLAARWLRRAANGFEHGVLSDDEITLGQGFRNLRAYLILVGVASVLSLINTLYQLS